MTHQFTLGRKIKSGFCMVLIWCFSLYTSAQETNTYDFLDAYPVKILPLQEKTKLDNNAPKNHLTFIQKKALSFDQIDKDWKDLDFGVLYKLDISKQYKTLVIYYHWGMELRTVLVNYDQKYNLIDHELVAFDEDAEGWTVSESTITKDRIHRMDALYIDPEQIEYNNFIFDPNGKIIIDTDFYKEKTSGPCFYDFEPQEIKYVHAKSGLNVRDKNGNKIGKLPFGSKVEIIKYTNKKLTIKDNGKIVKGTIVEICYNTSIEKAKRAYIFDGYLSKKVNKN